MNAVLSRWNLLPSNEAAQEVLPCCGSRAWANNLANSRPIEDVDILLATSDTIWRNLTIVDWLEAFQSHPRIGETWAPRESSARAHEWSGQEQQRAAESADSLKPALAEANREYEQRFHRIFIICASGRSVEGILSNLRQRLNNDDATELREAAEEQRQITRIRLRKWLAE